MSNIRQALQTARTENDAIRNASEEMLKQASEHNFPLFLQSLATELASSDLDEDTRQLAGLVFKNSIYAKESPQKEILAGKWSVIGEGEKQVIKNLLLSTLPVPISKPRHTAARVVAHIALIELPEKRWMELIPQSIQSFKTSPDINLKISILQTIGYICEEINPEAILEFVNPILDCITIGMSDENNAVRLAGTQALYYALEFVKTNFDNPREREVIMSVIFNNCNSNDVNIKRVAFENLVKIVRLYYQHVVEFMKQIFDVTVPIIQNCEEVNVVTQAIEFWITLAEEEFEYEVDAEKTVTLKALPHIVPILLKTLNKQAEFDNDGGWGITPAGSVCILSMARLIGDGIVELVLPFVTQNITDTEWRNRDAACIALGSIVDGPSPKGFENKLNQILANLLALLKDQNENVKDTAAWTIGRICSHQIKSVAPVLDKLLTPIMEATTDTSYKVAAHACWAIHNICQAFEYGHVGPFPSLAPASLLIAQCLITAIHRADSNEDSNKLKINGYEALNSLINYSRAESNLISEILNIIITDFEKSFQVSTLDQDDLEDQYMTQKLLCSSIQAISTTYKDCIKPQAGKIMDYLIKLFTTGAKKNPLIYEESLLAIDSVILALENDFAPHVASFFPILKLCLQSIDFGSVPHLAIGIVSDLSRIFLNHFAPYAVDLVPLVINALSDPRMVQEYKPAAITCLGDIAVSIGSEFIKFLDPIMNVLVQASHSNIEDDPEFLNELRESILASFTEIIHGLQTSGKPEFFAPYTTHVLNFITTIYHDKHRNEEVTSSAIGLLGDINQTLPSTNLQHEVIKNLVSEGVQKNLPIANWAAEQIFQGQLR